MLNEYKTIDFGLKLREGTNIRDIENPSTQLGKVWANFIRDLESIGATVTEGATFAGPGATGVKVPSAILAGSKH